MNTINIISISLLLILMQAPKEISRNGMRVNWQYAEERIWVEMTAPTDGWLAIGFNESQSITGNYLLMGRVRDGRAELVEYVTLAPRKYQPIQDMEAAIQVADISGDERNGKTRIKFSLPLKAEGKYRKNLYPDSQYVLLLAYSQDDDFQHHSRMRTSVKIQL